MTDFPLPARRSWYLTLRDWILASEAQIDRRRSFKRLLDLDDHMLRDIGVTRHEVEHAAGLPLSRDAGSELQRLALSRRQRR